MHETSSTTKNESNTTKTTNDNTLKTNNNLLPGSTAAAPASPAAAAAAEETTTNTTTLTTTSITSISTTTATTTPTPIATDKMTNEKDKDGNVQMTEASSSPANDKDDDATSITKPATTTTTTTTNNNNKNNNTQLPSVVVDDKKEKEEDNSNNNDNNSSNSSNNNKDNNRINPNEKKDTTTIKESSTSPQTTANGTSSHATTTTTTTTTTPVEKKTTTTAAAAAAAASTNNANNNNTNNPPPPVMRGTLSYNEEKRQHVMRGMWNYENSKLFPAQRFELLRNLTTDERLEQLPADGEFHGSFSLTYLHTTSKGRHKERSKVVPESGVKIKFVRIDDTEYTMTGKGTNQFGIFHINGHAKPSHHEGDPVWHVEFRKRYEPPPEQAAGTIATTATTAAAAATTNTTASTPLSEAGPLPEPSPFYDTGVVCLRGKVLVQTSQDLGSTEMVHRITGLWSSGLNFILADPQNNKGLLSKFEYEHKSMVPTQAFPVSGRYSGWFDLMLEDGSRTKINETNVQLKFRKNNAGYFNIEGKGSNVYGKYSITGTLTVPDNVITIFKHFQPRKIKASKSVTPPPPPINSATAAPRRASSAAIIANPTLKLSDAKIPEEAEDPATLQAMPQPAHATYSAVSRGVLRVNDDGSHSCTGKWAVTREHFTSGQTSPFTVRLDSHYAKEAAVTNERQFPLDSAMYKGSFQLKKSAGRYQTIVDDQVVMRFRPNQAGSYNVYGRGVNAIGVFIISGTLIMNGKNGGHIEIYRMYPPELLTPQPTASGKVADGAATSSGGGGGGAPTTATKTSKPNLPQPPAATSLQRRESTRTVKLPSRLEDDDPTAQMARIMDRCSQILRIMREKDVELGGFFSDPVDPVALGIPTYHQIIKEPMDLRTIARKMEGNEIDNPEEFSRLMRLVFENAMRFNVDPAHSVHQAARNLLIQFNQRFRDVERMIQNFRRVQGDDKKESKKKKKEPPKPKTIREIRLEEAQSMATESAEAMGNLVAAAPAISANVSRTEFSLLLRMIQQMNNQMVQTHRLLALLSPDEVEAQPTTVPDPALSSISAVVPAPTPVPRPTVPEKKKSAPKRKAEVMEEPIVTPDLPLTRDEQELLTETINELPSEHLGGVIQIIREAAPVGADEDEIDLDIDQLSPSTQRKLLRHVSKFVKKPKSKAKKAKTSAADRKGKGGSRKSTPVPASTPASARPPASAPAPAASVPPKPANTSALFGLDDKDDSDSDSDDDKNSAPAATSASKRNATNQSHSGQPAGGKEFKLSSGLGALAVGNDDDDDDDDDEEDGEIGFNTSSWSLSKPEDSSKGKAAALDDDAWAAARKSAEETKAFENQRKAREAKMKAEAEEAKKQRLKDAAQRGEEIRAQRQEEEAREAALREQREKEAEEARQAAREAARAQVNAVEQTVDLDAQRDIMAQYEQSFLDKDMGSASPSSDFGF